MSTPATNSTRRRSAASPARRGGRRFVRVLKATGLTLLVLANIAAVAGLLLSGYAGMFDPREHNILPILGMTFPAWPPAALVLAAIDLMVPRWRLLSLAPAGAMLCTLPMITDVFPLHGDPGPVPMDKQSTAWTLMSYNTAMFVDQDTPPYPHGINPTVSYIIGADPDVAVLVETPFMQPVPWMHLTRQQNDTIHDRYPYIIVDEDITLLSKFPARPLPCRFTGYQGTPGAGHVSAWVVDVYGTKVTIFGLHLCSIGLTRDDKDLYRDLTRGQVDTNHELGQIKSELLKKLAVANAQRAQQVQQLQGMIRKYGGENTIVCGDFNDVPGCYALRRLEDMGFEQSWPRVGLGYMYTYNRERMYFSIDHILSRGLWQPWTMQRGDLTSSDHYPLTVTFVEK